MTTIYDSGGRWEATSRPKKRRKPSQPKKFAGLKVGDQLMQSGVSPLHRGRMMALYYVVTDMWFDPVRGEKDPIAGQMVGYAHIHPDGRIGPKSSTPIRGLASQQFDFADIDYLALCAARIEGFQEGVVVGIGAKVKKRQRGIGTTL